MPTAGGNFSIRMLGPPLSTAQLQCSTLRRGDERIKNLILEHRHFTRSDEMPALATELVRLHPHVIVAGAGRAALALKAVTKTVPIVMANSNDAITQGLLARGGSVD